jgi:hypothetical protein
VSVYGPTVTRRELDRLALLRVMALAHPDREKVEVFRSDVLDLLAVVDRLTMAPRAHTMVTVTMGQPPTVALMTGPVTVHQSGDRQ